MGTLIPCWARRAVEPGQPGFVECLTPDFEPDQRPVRTTLVTARLVYVFSHAHHLRPSDEALAAARHGLDFLLTRCRGPGGLFRHAVDPDGAPIDPRSDLYDLAFVLFALAWFARASGETAVLAVADDTMDFIERSLVHGQGGYAEDTSGTLPRRQNPHMHLLEAFHALSEVSSDRRWLERAEAVVDLMRDRLFDRETGSLGEFFEEDWEPAAGEPGLLREPGHHLEWVWLLHHHGRLTGGPSIRDLAGRLYAFALSHGFARMPDRLPVVVDGVDRYGRATMLTRLLWPQTEALKAFAARVEFVGDRDAAERLEAHLELLFRHYVDPQTGLWFNQLSPQGEPVRTALPVRVLYHLVLAIAEVARIRP